MERVPATAMVSGGKISGPDAREIPLKSFFADPPIVRQTIVTRFNLRLANNNDAYRRPDWLARRLHLVKRFSAPSIRVQRWPFFEWWILCDVTTPADLLAAIRGLDPRVRIGLVGPEEEIDAASRLLADGFISDANSSGQLLDRGVDIHMTTRVDSDDGLDRDFTRAVADRLPIFLATALPRFLIVSARGYQWHDTEKYLIPMTVPRGPMQTMYERADLVSSFHGAYVGNHNHSAEKYPGFADVERVAYVYVFHGDNEVGKMRRSRVRLAASDLGDQFHLEW